MSLRLPTRLHWALQSSCISLLSSWYNRGGGGGDCKHSPQATGRQSTCKPHPDHCPHYPAAGLEKGPHREWVTYPRPCLLPQAWELPQPGTG